MTRVLVATGFAVVLAISGCKPTPPAGQQKSGPAVAQGEGVVVTVAEFEARLNEQSPFLRQRYQNLDRKKEFLDSLVKFEILANAAQKEGYAERPRRPADHEEGHGAEAGPEAVRRRRPQGHLRRRRPEVLRRAQGRLREAGPRAHHGRARGRHRQGPGPEERPGEEAARPAEGRPQEGPAGAREPGPRLLRRRGHQGQRRRPGLPLAGGVLEAVRRSLRGGRLRHQGRRGRAGRDAAGLLDRPRHRPAGGRLPHRRAGEAADRSRGSSARSAPRSSTST